MKTIILSAIAVFGVCIIYAQVYPDPQFSNEVYYLKKDQVYTLTRLEKGSSKIETKTKIGGFGGSESEYSIDGGSSPIRIKGGSNLSFVISSGGGFGAGTTSTHSDSMMRANGMDPSMLQGMGSMMDPVNRITLYRAETGNGKRIVLLQKNHGGLPFTSKKIKSSEKYTFSVKNIRKGYWELVVDKTLPGGEYAFTMMDMTGGAASDGIGVLLFTFGVD